MRPIWKGSIGFGLVTIPVKLYSATQQSSLDLDMVDRRDMGKIKYQRVNAATGEEVKWEEIGKAYKLDGNYVLLEDEDFAKAAPEKSKIIEVNNFVKEEEIDTIFYENSYYLEPEKAGVKAYALLREALKKSGRVGVAQFVLRSSATLTALKPKGKMLVLSKLRFAEEIRGTEDFDIPEKVQISPGEMKMALTLIDQFSTPFDITKFKDEYASALVKVIKAKASGKKIPARKLRIAHTKSDDLLEQLKASLNRRKAS